MEGELMPLLTNLIGLAMAKDVDYIGEHQTFAWTTGTNGFGAHAVFCETTSQFFNEELVHLWQSRSMGDGYLLNYFATGTFAYLLHTSNSIGIEDIITRNNYYETMAKFYYQIWK
jgi:hypothetical protein